MQEKCKTCQLYDVIDGGDIVPYGYAEHIRSTVARLPEVHGCVDEHDIDEDGNEVDTEGCRYYVEIPRCPKHPHELVWPRSGCNACEAEYYFSIEQDTLLANEGREI